MGGTMRQAFEGPEEHHLQRSNRMSGGHMRTAFGRPGWIRLVDMKSSALSWRHSRESERPECRQRGHWDTDSMSSSLWLEDRVQEGVPCKLNCKSRPRLNPRGPLSMPKWFPKLPHMSSLGVPSHGNAVCCSQGRPAPGNPTLKK